MDAICLDPIPWSEKDKCSSGKPLLTKIEGNISIELFCADNIPLPIPVHV